MKDWLETDLARYERQQEAYENALPECRCCGEKIYGEYAWRINDELLCEECLNEYLYDCRVSVEDLIND